MTSVRTPTQVGAVLLARRQSLNLSQKAVAARLGISQNRLSELEKHPDRLTLDRLLALANLLGLEFTLQPKVNRASARTEW